MVNPDVDLLVNEHDAQSESENVVKPEILEPEKNSPRPGEFLTYLKILFIFLLSPSVGFVIF